MHKFVHDSYGTIYGALLLNKTIKTDAFSALWMVNGYILGPAAGQEASGSTRPFHWFKPLKVPL